MKKIKLLAIGALVMGAFCFGKVVGTSEAAALEYPEMNAAKKNLEAAKANLQKAAKSFSGHRDEAIKYADKAIKEIDEGILAADKEK
jgi:hypothetical protein